MTPGVKRFFRLVTAIARFKFFEESRKPATPTKKSRLQENAEPFSGIRCPICKWQPKESSRWFCGDCDYPEYFFEGCGTAWNSFKTRGLCPGCGHQWRWTVCLSCYGWSPHNDWYTENSTSFKR